MLEYRFLKNRGALNEADEEAAPALPGTQLPGGFIIHPHAIALVPESVARENLVLPLTFDGNTLILAAVNAADVMLADKLSLLLNKKVRLITAPRGAIIEAINRHYGKAETEAVDSLLAECTDTAVDQTMTASYYAKAKRGWGLGTIARSLGKGIVEFKKGIKGVDDEEEAGLDATANMGGSGVLFYVVEEGQRVLLRRPDGTMTIIVGPRRVWQGRNRFTPLAHYVAHPGEFLLVRYRDGRQEHLAGPTDLWLDPRVHQGIAQQDGLQIAAKEAVVVYSRASDSGAVSRRIVYGPSLFIPQAGEWLHTFSWHSSRGGHKGVQKEPNALVFQKLWLMPDQMYHDVADVRSADDAVLTVRLMIFFELTDIERMLETTHDPIGDFVNAATSDVVDFVGRYDFESFKRNTNPLNHLETYAQLTGRAGQCGYRINKVVYRGYGAPESLQQMHDQAIEARTRLQLQRATEQQAQDLENYKLDCQIARATKRRGEQAAELDHALELASQRQKAELQQKEAQFTLGREQRRLQDIQQREHLAVLRDMGVDLTAFLTQGRADRVIELRGGAETHLHLEREGEGATKES